MLARTYMFIGAIWSIITFFVGWYMLTTEWE